MLASRVAALALAAGALVVAANPAFAAVEVDPNPVAPGGTVTVNDGFGSMLCPETDPWATADSKGFVGDSIKLTRGTHSLVGTGKAVWKPGTYPVSITCASGGSSGRGTFNLVVSARGAARTGDGASILGSGSNEAAGIAVLGAALAVGAVAVRRKVKADR